MHRAIQKLIPLLISSFLLTACNENQPAQPIGFSQSSAAAANTSASSTTAVGHWLVVKKQEYGDSGVVIVLDAKVTNNTATKIQWQQTRGPEAAILNAESLKAEVVLPFVTAPTTLRFTISATDAAGKTHTATQSLTALPLTSRATVTNPVLAATDTAVTLNLTQTVPANSLF
ncbi:MAG: hypothetical protein U5M23_05915 [Marinagarivorans sp.]|nr:hypothetical protein [Marinagarivorans sp.]